MSTLLIVNGTALTVDEKKFKRDLLEMFSEELQESEKDMMNAIDGLRLVIHVLYDSSPAFMTHYRR